jgi:hypothetical protein
MCAAVRGAKTENGAGQLTKTKADPKPQPHTPRAIPSHLRICSGRRVALRRLQIACDSRNGGCGARWYEIGAFGGGWYIPTPHWGSQYEGGGGLCLESVPVWNSNYTHGGSTPSGPRNPISSGPRGACFSTSLWGLEIACKICINSDSAMNFVLLLLASAAAARDLPVKTLSVIPLAPPADVVLQENATIGCDSWKSCATCKFTSIKPGVYLKLCDHRCWWDRRVYMVQKRCWIMHDHCNDYRILQPLQPKGHIKG